MARACVILATTLLLSACATSYEAPVTTAAARIRIAVPQSKNFASVRMMGYPSGRCDNPMSIGLIGGIGRRSKKPTLGIPGSDDYADKSFIERSLPAGTPYLFTLKGFYSSGTCTISASFVPQAGHDYEAVFTWEGGYCYTRVSEVSVGADGSVRRSAEFPTQVETCDKGFF